ncbi:transcriptional regulator, AraC family [Mucilaginibacter frigoritolerans]|uniref:Transcriptional regulator, AraC family n=1 Tax=Mucilaginibacter frigoritolerans TaxID=652788 RepID=A0A562UFS7_9SPHI|nr:helix-turn-helix domain-containing protein [Mucilaginibacter frigoritolerans]TWJ04680.1 transcriptional regulator, AraC family [Mucilaginibacter frigoritolerans]
MEKDNKVFNNLRDQYNHMGLPVDLIDANTDFTIFNLKDVIHQSLPFKSPGHRLNFFVFVFIKNGFGEYTVDEQKVSLQPYTVYFTNPGHYRSYEWTVVEEVYLITLSESFLKENVHADIFEEFPFLLAEIFPGRLINEALFSEFERLYLQIHTEYINNSPYRTGIIANLFVVLLLKIKACFWLDYNPIYEGNRSSLIVKNFKRLLEKHYRDLSEGKAERAFRIQEYADAQNLHPNYLSTVIKTKTGKPVGTWIAEKTIAEAKSLLQNSSISIKEVAYRLGFAELAHFSNYFKKHTHISPVQFRKNDKPSAS